MLSVSLRSAAPALGAARSSSVSAKILTPLISRLDLANHTAGPQDLRSPCPQVRLGSTHCAPPKHPRYAVSSYEHLGQTIPPRGSGKLFSQRIRRSPFNKALDQLEKLHITDHLNKADKKSRRTDILNNVDQLLKTIPTKQEQSDLLKTLEFQLLGPQAEIGSGKAQSPACIAQLQYDCYRLLAEHDLSFEDLHEVVSVLQQARQTLGDNSVQACAPDAEKAPWPTSPASPQLDFREFKAHLLATTSAPKINLK